MPIPPTTVLSLKQAHKQYNSTIFGSIWKGVALVSFDYADTCVLQLLDSQPVRKISV